MKLGVGVHGDGGGLWLRKTGKDSGSWCYRYQINKKAHEVGLGGINTVSLVEARAAALELRKLYKTTKERVDPLAKKRADAAKAKIEKAAAVTFKDFASEYIETHRAGWSNAKHAWQWSQTLRDYVHPLIGDMPVAAIDTEAVKRVLLQPKNGATLWMAKPETASRIRSRIEKILGAAAISKQRVGDNPAKWAGHLEHVFVSRKKAEKGQERHHAALPYNEVPGFMAELRKREDIAARALEFCILTGARIGEVRLAVWDVIDLPNKLWIIPATKMKMREKHEIPLCDRALEILKLVEGESGYVFPSRGGAPLSDRTILGTVTSIRPGFTTHGFRSTFRDWAGDCTEHPRDICEMSLSHQVGSKTENSYRRSRSLDKRRKLLDDWSRYCGGQTADICEFLSKRTG
jgi:integrase